MIVTVTPTVIDGTVVRWYFVEVDAEISGVDPDISASRNGVRIGTFLHLVPADVLATAQQAHETLNADHHANLRHLATHRRGGLFGPLKPITAGSR